MSNRLFKNGYIIKSYAEKSDCPNELLNYVGIGRYTTWPLEELSDRISVALTRESEERWFGYQDERLWVVPDSDFLQRYEKHCKDLHIQVFCLQVESENPIIVTSTDLSVNEVLEFDYADTDMSTSCLYDDLTMNEHTVTKRFKPVMHRLNSYGLLNSAEEVQDYLKLRNELITAGYDMEEYYSPTIVRLSRAVISEA